MMAKTMRAALLAATALAGSVAAPAAWAQAESFCRGDARNVERDLTLRGDRISPQDRIMLERRLSMSSTLCDHDPSRASSDLEQLRRDMILQAQRPQTDGRASRPPDG